MTILTITELEPIFAVTLGSVQCRFIKSRMHKGFVYKDRSYKIYVLLCPSFFRLHKFRFSLSEPAFLRKTLASSTDGGGNSP